MSKPMVSCTREVSAYVDDSKPVQIYRNLHKKCLSVRQGGKVRCHTLNVVLKDVTFHVGEKGRQRVLDTKQKNVHAYAKGMLCNVRECDGLLPMWEEISYNPYLCDSFYSKCGGKIEAANYVDFDLVDVQAHGITFKVET